MVLAPLVIDLGIILMFLVALALCLLAKPIVSALFQIGDSVLGHIPWLGGRISGTLHSIERRVTRFLGLAVTKLEARIGIVFHSAARLVEEVGGKIESAFELIFALSEALLLLATWKSVLALYHSLVGQTKATVTTVKDHTKVIHSTVTVVTHVVKVVEHVAVRAAAIPADVVIPRDLAGLRGRVREAEHEIGRLWDRVRGISPAIVGGIAVGALAFALARLRMGWLRCSNVDKVGRRVCGMDHTLLEALLVDSLAIAGTLSLVEFAREMVGVTDTAVRPITTFWRAS